MLNLPSPIQELSADLLIEKEIQLFVKRDDLIHPEISGNKWRKLSENIKEMEASNKEGIVSFGGAFSNHLYALAASGKLFNFKTIGLVRGEEGLNNSTLSFCKSKGMQLEFLSRADYKLKDKPEFLSALKNKYPQFLIVSEGGANQNGRLGCQEIYKEIINYKKHDFDYLLLSAGTGTTAGGICSVHDNVLKIGIVPALKGEWMEKEISNSLNIKSLDKKRVNFFYDYHFGGYAKFDAELINFINKFKSTFEIQLDPIYTGKLFYGVFDLIKKDYFQSGSKILILHSGGLQGIDGFNAQHGNLIH